MPMPDNLYKRVEMLCEKAKGINGYCMDVFDFLYVLDEEWDIKNNGNLIIYIDPLQHFLKFFLQILGLAYLS